MDFVALSIVEVLAPVHCALGCGGDVQWPGASLDACGSAGISDPPGAERDDGTGNRADHVSRRAARRARESHREPGGARAALRCQRRHIGGSKPADGFHSMLCPRSVPCQQLRSPRTQIESIATTRERAVRGNVATGTRFQSEDGPGSAVRRSALILFSVFRLQGKKWTDGQHIHPGALEAVDRLFGRAHDRLVLIEARVQHDRDAGLALKALIRS